MTRHHRPQNVNCEFAVNVCESAVNVNRESAGFAVNVNCGFAVYVNCEYECINCEAPGDGRAQTPVALTANITIFAVNAECVNCEYGDIRS